MKFGDKLSQLRRKNGLSQEELGEKLNVTRQTISKWELGQSKPDTDKLMEISKLLNVDFNQLIDDESTIEDNISNTNINPDEVRPRKWLLVLLIIIAILIVIILANKFVTTRKEKAENNKGSIFGIFDNVFEEIGDYGKDVFNNTFEFRIGTQSEDSVSWLLDDIITNNKTNSDHIISVVFEDINTSDPNEIKDIKKKLGTTWDEYEVSADYDENGYINKITIETISNENNDLDTASDDNSNYNDDITVRQFNGKFELYAGTKYGSAVSMLLDNVITNNKTNSNHILRVIYGDTNTIDESEIRNLKKKLDIWTQYEVIIDYDEVGFVNQVTIEN